MMSSVIPARLDFQCGHAALVSLPRVKGESSAQRSLRIAMEKSGAQSRACDFCAPRLNIVVAVASPPEVVLASEPVVAAPLEDAVVALADVVLSTQTPVVSPPLVVVAAPSPVAETVEERETPALAPVSLPVAPLERRPASRTNGTSTTHPVRRAASPRVRSTAAGGATRRRFVVHFEAETVLEAADIRHALRLAAALGAKDVLAITRDV